MSSLGFVMNLVEIVFLSSDDSIDCPGLVIIPYYLILYNSKKESMVWLFFLTSQPRLFSLQYCSKSAVVHPSG